MPEEANPFIREVYPDGDMDYRPPRWKEKLDKYKVRRDRVEHSSENSKDYIIKEDEIALKHPHTGAIVKLCDDGCIDLFAGEQLGIRLDPNTETANIFADNINFFGKNVNFRTNPHGLTWNGYAFNPALHEEEEQAVPVMVKSEGKMQYSEGIIEILAELGLPVNDIE